MHRWTFTFYYDWYMLFFGFLAWAFSIFQGGERVYRGLRTGEDSNLKGLGPRIFINKLNGDNSFFWCVCIFVWATLVSLFCDMCFKCVCVARGGVLVTDVWSLSELTGTNNLLDLYSLVTSLLDQRACTTSSSLSVKNFCGQQHVELLQGSSLHQPIQALVPELTPRSLAPDFNLDCFTTGFKSESLRKYLSCRFFLTDGRKAKSGLCKTVSGIPTDNFIESLEFVFRLDGCCRCVNCWSWSLLSKLCLLNFCRFVVDFKCRNRTFFNGSSLASLLPFQQLLFLTLSGGYHDTVSSNLLE